MKPYDSNKQTALDMAFARNRTSIAVENVRNFLHRELLPRIPHQLVNFDLDGRDSWERRRKIFDILENDPVFDKSKR